MFPRFNFHQSKFEMTFCMNNHEVLNQQSINYILTEDYITSVKFNFITQQRHLKDFVETLPSLSRLCFWKLNETKKFVIVLTKITFMQSQHCMTLPD